MDALFHRPKILPCGDCALSVEFGETIDVYLNTLVMNSDGRARILEGVIETVPTYRSLLICFDPEITNFETLSAQMYEIGDGFRAEPRPGRLWRIPVVYGGMFGLDIETVASQHGMSTTKLIDLHSAPTYHVHMIGFVPGFAYLGGLDPTLATPRRAVPRMRTPAGTISIGGSQALVASIEAPSGWHLLGRTPMRNFMLDRDPVFLLEPGDQVRFDPIAPQAWADLDWAAAQGEWVGEVVA